MTQKAICSLFHFWLFFFFLFLNQERKTALGTSAYEKSQRNEDVLACRSVITGVRRGGWMFLIVLSSASLPALISSLWHEGGAVAPPVRPRLRLPPPTLSSLSHFSLAPLCHIDLSVSVEGKIINANSPAVQPTNKTCLIHQADIAIKTSLSLSPLCPGSPAILSHLWATSPPHHHHHSLSPFCVEKTLSLISLGKRSYPNTPWIHCRAIKLR